jgi:hypothetical protein
VGNDRAAGDRGGDVDESADVRSTGDFSGGAMYSNCELDSGDGTALRPAPNRC